MSESSFRTRAREIAVYLYSTKLPHSTRFFRLYPWGGTPRGAPVKWQDLPRTRLVTSALRCSRLDVVFDRRMVLRHPVTPGKSSRRPAPRPAAPACGPPRTFSRGDGVPEIRPLVEHDIQFARRGGVASRSPRSISSVPAPQSQSTAWTSGAAPPTHGVRRVENFYGSRP